jgi:hypothetical protein
VARRLLDVLTVLSLVLCVAVCVVWALSYAQPVWQLPTTAPATGSYKRQLILGRGYVAVSTIKTPARPPGAGAGYPIGGHEGGWKALGLQWQHQLLTLLGPDDRAVGKSSSQFGIEPSRAQRPAASARTLPPSAARPPATARRGKAAEANVLRI